MTHDLIVRNATLPDGRTGQDIAIRAGRIVAIGPAIEGDAPGCSTPPATSFRRLSSTSISTWTRRSRSDCRVSTSPARCSKALHSGASSSRSSRTRRSSSERCATATSLSPGTPGHPLATSTSATTGFSRSTRCSRSSAVSRPISTCSSSPFRRTATTARRGRRQPGARPRPGRRGGRRHSAFRAHHGGRRGVACAALRDRGRARASASICIATKPTIRCSRHIETLAYET